MNNLQKNIVSGSFFFYDGRLIADKGLTFATRDIFEKLIEMPKEEHTARSLVGDFRLKWESVYTALLELTTLGYVKYDVANDIITIL